MNKVQTNSIYLNQKSYNIIIVFTVTFKLNASLLNKSINLFIKNTNSIVHFSF